MPKPSHEESEREAGLEFGEECATEDAEYCELLRIASAVEEVRREIEAQGHDKLQFQFWFHRRDANFGAVPGDASGSMSRSK